MHDREHLLGLDDKHDGEVQSQASEKTIVFGNLLRSYRERSELSRNRLAYRVGVDPSYLTRIEHGDREPPRRHIIEALIGKLRITPLEANILRVAGGLAPKLAEERRWDETLQQVSDIIGDPRLTQTEVNAYRGVIQNISDWFKQSHAKPREGSSL